MISYDDLQRKAAEKLQVLFGSELLNLDECRKLKDKIDVDIQNIQKQLFANEVNDDFASVNIALRHVEYLTRQTESVASEVERYVKEVCLIKEELDKHLLQINTINLVCDYTKIVKCIESFSNELHKHMRNRNKSGSLMKLKETVN